MKVCPQHNYGQWFIRHTRGISTSANFGLSFPWTSLLCPHYVGGARLFRILRRMNTLRRSHWVYWVCHIQPQWTGTINTMCLNRNTQHLPHLYGISVQHIRDSLPQCFRVSACISWSIYTHTHFSLRNPSTFSDGNYPISLFFSFKWNNILNYTKAPNSISAKLSQSLHHKPFLFLPGLCIIGSTGSLQRSPTAETTLPFQFYEPSLMSPRRDCFYLFRLLGWILLSTAEQLFCTSIQKEIWNLWSFRISISLI